MREEPPRLQRRVNDQAISLAREWRMLGRAASVVALFTSPVLFVLFYGTYDWPLGWALLGAVAGERPARDLHRKMRLGIGLVGVGAVAKAASASWNQLAIAGVVVAGLVTGGAVTGSQAQPFVTELAWLGTELERLFPLARAFVRPGFDEPDEAAALVDD